MPDRPPEAGLPAIRMSPLHTFRALIRDSMQLPSPGESSVAFWRQRIIELLLVTGATLGFLVYVPSVLLSVRVHLWGVVVGDTLAYAWVAAAALSPGWSHTARAKGILLVFYLLSLVLLLRVGTAGAGMLWIAAVPVLAALLLGLREAVAAWCLALVTLAGCAWGLSAGYILAYAGTGIFNLDVAAWWVYSANALFLSAVLAVPTAILLRGLEHTNQALAQAERERARINGRLGRVQALEALGVLVAGVAHNINNVLAVILGTASLREQQATQASDRTDFRIIGLACRRGRDVLKSLLHFAQPSLSVRAPFELHALIGEVCQLLASTTRNRIAIVTLFQPEPLWILGDAASISHALMNLALNALDAMPGGGTLTFRTSAAAAGWLELRVEDTGAGMPPGILDRVLEPFFTTKEVGKGTGLGLSMTYGVVKAHGGTLELASQPGKGTQVKLLLPRIPQPPVQAEPGGPEPGLRFSRVLLVDDDEDVRFLMTRILRKAGVEQVKAVAGGAEALASLRSGDVPDLVILDQNMPGMNGAQVLAELRKLFPELPVLISSGQPDIEDWPTFSQPWVGVIAKPFDVEEISAKLARCQQDWRDSPQSQAVTK